LAVGYMLIDFKAIASSLIHAVVPSFALLKGIGSDVEKSINSVLTALKAGDLSTAIELLTVSMSLHFKEAFAEITKGWSKLIRFMDSEWNSAPMRGVRYTMSSAAQAADDAKHLFNQADAIASGVPYDPSRYHARSEARDFAFSSDNPGTKTPAERHKIADDLFKDEVAALKKSRNSLRWKAKHSADAADLAAQGREQAKIDKNALEKADADALAAKLKALDEFTGVQGAMAARAKAAKEAAEKAKKTSGKMIESVSSGKIGDFDKNRAQSMFNKLLNDTATKQLEETKRARLATERLVEIAESADNSGNGIGWGS
jgi:hypothetical protein